MALSLHTSRGPISWNDNFKWVELGELNNLAHELHYASRAIEAEISRRRMVSELGFSPKKSRHT